MDRTGYVVIIGIILLLVIIVIIVWLMTRVLPLSTVVPAPPNPILNPSPTNTPVAPVVAAGTNMIGISTGGGCHKHHRHHCKKCDYSRDSDSSTTRDVSSATRDDKSDSDSSDTVSKRVSRITETKSSETKSKRSETKSNSDKSEVDSREARREISSSSSESESPRKYKVRSTPKPAVKLRAKPAPKFRAAKYSASTEDEFKKSVDKVSTPKATIKKVDTPIIPRSITETETEELSPDPVSTSRSVDVTNFHMYNMNCEKVMSPPQLNGIVDYALVHDGKLYVHVLGNTCSGIYRLEEKKWVCLLGTSDNKQGLHNNSELDITRTTTITHLYKDRNGVLCVGTRTSNYTLINSNGKVLIRPKLDIYCLDRHNNHSGATSEVYINAAGQVYFNDKPIESRVWLDPGTTVRCHGNNMLCLSNKQDLLAVAKGKVKKLDTSVDCFDTNGSTIAYVSNEKLFVVTGDDQDNSTQVDYRAIRIAMNDTHIYTMY